MNNGASYAWKSIWTAKKALIDVLCWRVGSSNRVSIFNDAWFLGSLSYRSTNPISRCNLELVTGLIYTISRAWRVEVITNSFKEADAERILRIRLAAEPSANELVWMGDL